MRMALGALRLNRTAGWLVADSSRLMIAAGILALVIANAIPGLRLQSLWTAGFTLDLDGAHARVDLSNVIVNGLMTVFFLCVGIEIRREIAVGALRSVRTAIAPVLCALGGMLVPMGLYVLLAGHGRSSSGWAVPCATDIALAVGVAGIVAPGLSAGARAFLLTLAVADDLGGIAVIGIWYSHGISLLPAAASLACAVLFAGTLYLGMWPLPFGLILLVPAWLLMWRGHVEPPIVGALFGIVTPVAVGRHGTNVRVQAERFLARLSPIVGLVILPAFAAISATVPISLGAAVSTTAIGVAVGLFLGKPLGIFGTLKLITRTGLARHPDATTDRDLLGVSMLGGVGFTVSLFIARVGLPSGGLRAGATLGVFAGSLVAGLGSALYFRVAVRRDGLPVAT